MNMKRSIWLSPAVYAFLTQLIKKSIYSYHFFIHRSTFPNNQSIAIVYVYDAPYSYVYE